MGMKKFLLGLVGIVCALFTISAHALPAGYTELEYIESTGTQYLDLDTGTQTGVFKIIADVYAAGSTDWQYLFGYSKDAGGSPLGVWVSNDQIKETFTAGNGNVIADVNKWEHIDITNSNKVTISDFYIFHVNPTGVTSYTINHGRIKYLQLKKDGDTIRDMVSVKRNSDGVVGMYDTVSNTFYTNAGSGTFIAGPVVDNSCRNLFDSTGVTDNHFISSNGTFSAYAGFGYTQPIPVEQNTSYTLSGINGYGGSTRRVHAYNNNGEWIAQIAAIDIEDESEPYSVTGITPTNTAYIRVSYAISDTNVQLERGTTATAYVPYVAACHKIQVATTKYVETEFSALNTALANAVATVNTVVTQTIAQAASIATLQSGKQTRPDETCPAGIKCLLVEDTNGTPHWYAIQESYLPLGYTPLEYIESTGTQYIDTGITGTQDTAIETKFINLSSDSSTTVLIGDGWSNSSYLLSIVAQTGAPNRIGSLNNMLRDFWQTGQDYIVKMDKTGLYVNNSKINWDGSATNFTTTKPLYLLGDPATSGRNSYAMLYYMKIYNNGTLVRDFVPAKNASGAIGMYDLVSGEFFTNRGSGSFIAGPVVE